MRLLVIRTSAMGDVALTIPVLQGMRQQFPDVELVLLTRPAFGPFFSDLPRLALFFPELKKKHKGLLGIFRLYKDIRKQYEINYVIDLHDVIRSKLLRFLFSLRGVRVAVIDKGRKEKRMLTSGRSKKQLKHAVERYCDVFAKAGFNVHPSEGRWIMPSPDEVLESGFISDSPDVLNIGVAPYARHKLKVWPEENMIQLLRLLSEKYKYRLLLFGGIEDRDKLEVLETKLPNSKSLAGKVTLTEELAIMTRLDLMIAMDSSNMHMAALVGTNVISIWGGTDPLTGFSAWKQSEENSVRIPVDELTCRPCTVYGKGECKRGDFACMNWLTPEIVFKRIDKILSTLRIIS